MAWRSSGENNDAMVNNLRRFGVISSTTVEQGFRNVDRVHFVPRGQEHMAHSDQPLKEGNVHLSAPHIYGSALEALELENNSSMSFLNVGSGTGYVSCIVADIMGCRSTHYGIEIHLDVVNHSKNAIDNWKRTSSTASHPHIEILHGNGLEVNATTGEAAVGFDRIYVGAAVERRNLNRLTKLLRPGGILVGPVDDELVKVVRIGSSGGSSSDNTEDFTQQVVSGVRFAPLLYFPRMETIVPSTVWSPAIHNHYPDSFRASCKEILLCSSSAVVQQPPRQTTPEPQTVNLAAMLPKVVWLEIMSFTHRNWFEPEQNEAAFLRRRLLEEQAETQRANQARLEAEARCRAAERERDMYRLLAQRFQNRLQDVLRQRGDVGESASNEIDDSIVLNQDDIEVALDSILNHRERRSIIVSTMLRRFQMEENDAEEELEDSEMEEEDEEEEDNDMHAQIAAAAVASNDAIDEDDDESNEGTARRSYRPDSMTMEDANDGDLDMSLSPTDAMSLVSRSQVRAVSIASDDL